MKILLHTFKYHINSMITITNAEFQYYVKPLTTKGIFRYVEGVHHGAGEFKYEGKEYVSKCNKPKLLKEVPEDIFKENKPKLLKQEVKLLEKNNIKLMQKQKRIINKTKKILLKALFIEIEKKDLSHIVKITKNKICFNSGIQLKSVDISKIDNTSLNNKCLKKEYVKNISTNHSVELMNIDSIKQITKNNIKQFIDKTTDNAKVNKVYDERKHLKLNVLFVNKNKKELLKNDIHFIDKNIETFLRNDLDSINKFAKELLKCTTQSMNKSVKKLLKVQRLRELFKSKFKLLRIDNLRKIDQVKSKILLKQENIKDVDKKNLILLKKSNSINIEKYPGAKLNKVFKGRKIFIGENYRLEAYKYHGSIMKIPKARLFHKFSIKKIFKLSEIHFLQRFNLSSVYKISRYKELKNNSSKSIEKFELKFIENKNITGIDLFYPKFTKKGNVTNINKYLPKSVKKEAVLHIYKNLCKDIIKKVSVSISTSYEKRSFEVTKRWWVIPPAEETDEKILPIDYDYLEHPLLGSASLGYSRIVYPDKNTFNSDEEYQDACIRLISNIIENIKTQYFIKNKIIIPYEYIPKVYKGHPNSMDINPYIKNNDSSRGLYEIPIAINIMVEMVNFVALIVHHWASQLCYCTGQEAMWFIMELLNDWLNMDTTIQELNSLDAKEHYERAYRWIRWEAEKIFFNCDYLKEKNRFRGLKYAGQLLANLIEYMKNHHFNVVPIWKDISRMDYWRAQSNADFNAANDILIKLDKVKYKRHLNIETRRLDKKSIEGIPRK